MFVDMKLTIQLQLLPGDNAPLLLRTMEAFNAAATHAARIAFEAGVICQPAIHARCYYELREKYGLSAQMAVRAIGKAAEVFRRDRTKCPVFKPHGAITYDERILSWKGLSRVSIWTMEGRRVLPYVFGEYQGQRLDRLKGQVDLVYRGGKFYLFATIDMPEGTPIEPADFLGVDLGIENLATDSDGNAHTGEAVEAVRQRHAGSRARLQSRGTRGAKKLLRRLSGREARFRRHHNHCIAKALVQRAKDTGRGIVLEDLSGIRERVTVRRAQRAKHCGWSFRQLREFVAYKARLAGVVLLVLSPRNSSRTCSECGHCEKGNRKSRDEFLCLHCGLSLPADLNAARTLRAWGASKPPLELSRSAAA